MGLAVHQQVSLLALWLPHNFFDMIMGVTIEIQGGDWSFDTKSLLEVPVAFMRPLDCTDGVLLLDHE